MAALTQRALEMNNKEAKWKARARREALRNPGLEWGALNLGREKIHELLLTAPAAFLYFDLPRAEIKELNERSGFSQSLLILCFMHLSLRLILRWITFVNPPRERLKHLLCFFFFFSPLSKITDNIKLFFSLWFMCSWTSDRIFMRHLVYPSKDSLCALFWTPDHSLRCC